MRRAVQPVAILGAAQTTHRARRDDASYAELAFEVVQELLQTTGWTHDRICLLYTSPSPRD